MSECTDANLAARSADTEGLDLTDEMSARQRRLFELLFRQGQELARMYVGALAIIRERRNPAAAYFVAHAARELVNRFPDYYLLPNDTQRGSRVEYVSEMDYIAPRWRKAFPLPTVTASPAPVAASKAHLDRTLSTSLFRRVDKFMEKHLQVRVRLSDKVTKLFETIQIVPAGADALHVKASVKRWLALPSWLHRRAHLGDRSQTAPDFDECVAQFTVVEAYLYSILSEFYESVEQLDAILAEANRPTS